MQTHVLFLQLVTDTLPADTVECVLEVDLDDANVLVSISCNPSPRPSPCSQLGMVMMTEWPWNLAWWLR
jgi:hypothetical protein